MLPKATIPGWKDKVLFTPGPLTTSRTVKQAMLRDLGSRDFEFIELVKDIRCKLVELGQASPEEYTTVLMQGSGTFGLEAVISSTVPPDGKLMVIINGAYGKRLAKMASVLKIETVTLECPENTTPALEQIEAALRDDPRITNVAVVHCETTTGIINPIREIGEIVGQAGAAYFVDAMSSYGAVPVNLGECGIDYLVSSANKCIEGVLEKNGQFRFTPPTHALIAFRQALAELEAEGGVAGRGDRYRRNYETLIEGMRRLRFKEYLRREDQGHIITSFLYPEDENFRFEEFYERLNARDYVIYPGKVSDADCFRIGNIGRISEPDVRALLAAIQETLSDMGVKLG